MSNVKCQMSWHINFKCQKTFNGDGHLKTIEILQWSLQNHWNLQWFPKNRWTCQCSSQINSLLKEWNYPVVTIIILIWIFCGKVWVSRPWYLWHLWHYILHGVYDIWDIFSVVMCEFHTVNSWSDVRSQEIWSISYRLYGCSFTPVSYTHLTLPTICSV